VNKRPRSARVVVHHKLTWQLASVLLGYPDHELVTSLPRLHALTGALAAQHAQPLRRFLGYAQAARPMDLAAHYVETFDHRRRCCPYLTYYAHGDTRKRGIALLAFKNAYRLAGVELGADELPDHLSVVLEFAATADPAAGRRLLLDHRAGIELLRLGLEDASSPYVDVVRAVTSTLPALAGPDREAVVRLAAAGPPAEQVGLQPFASPAYMPDLQGTR
jgi:nitrate reductase molybdenum cofactor assembly chaperone NarJ/NarW